MKQLGHIILKNIYIYIYYLSISKFNNMQYQRYAFNPNELN